MTNRNDILNELKELGSNLSVAPFENIYTVPVGYFEGFASQVFARIKALEATEAKDELNILSPYLNNLSKEIPFKTPAGYFDALDERMMNLVRSSADYLHKESFGQTTDEELESLSPLLQSLKKENPYTIPQGYFENLSVPVVEKTKVVSMVNRKWLRYAVAAMMIGLISMVGISIIKNNTGDPIAKIEKKATKEINKSSNEELNDFIQNTSTDVAAIEKKSDVELNDLLKDIPDEELNQFVEEIAEPQAESTESILN
jgi:hypothetical protein